MSDRDVFSLWIKINEAIASATSKLHRKNIFRTFRPEYLEHFQAGDERIEAESRLEQICMTRTPTMAEDCRLRGIAHG